MKDWEIKFKETLGDDILSSILGAHSEFCLPEDGCGCYGLHSKLKEFIRHQKELSRREGIEEALDAFLGYYSLVKEYSPAYQALRSKLLPTNDKYKRIYGKR